MEVGVECVMIFVAGDIDADVDVRKGVAVFQRP